MIKFRHILFTVLLGFVTLSLTGCQSALLNPKGVIAIAEKKLLIDSVLLMLIVVIPVIILNFVIAYRYRASNTKAKHSPNWSHSTLLEAVWWTIPCIIILILAIMTWVYTHRLDPYRPLNMKGKTLKIDVIAMNWRWLFIYPDQHVASMSFMQIPVNTQVKIVLTATGPMNSLEIPQLAGQIYAMAGMKTQLHFNALEAGDYQGLSTNYSGDGFSGMKFIVRAGSQKQFQAWVKKAQRSPKKLTMAAYNALAKDSKDTHVQLFSSPAKNLLNRIVMTYMMPVPAVAKTSNKSVHAK